MRGTRREQQHEVAIFPRYLMRHERDADEPLAEGQEEVEVTRCRTVGHRHVEPAAGTAGPDLMGGGMGIAEAVAAVGAEAEAPRRARRPRAGARDVAKPPGVAFAVEDLRVA